MIIVCVRASHNKEIRSPDFGIKRLNPESCKIIGNELENLKMLANFDNVVDKLLIASFFEENHLLVDALGYYLEAKTLSPDQDGFSTLYNNFLARNGISN